MKKNYDKTVALQCVTCGSDCSFETNEQTGEITCMKCNRVYHGGYDELVELNQKRIDDEIELTKEEIQADFEKDILAMFKKSGFKIK